MSARVMIVLFLVMVGILLTAGCGMSDHQAHTITMTRFDSYGSLEFSKTYEILGDAMGQKIIQTPEGDFIVSASVADPEHFCAYQGQLIKFSTQGDFLWKRFNEQGCYFQPFVNSGGTITAIGRNNLCQISPDGNVMRNQRLTFESRSVLETDDGGHILAGEILEYVKKTKEEFMKKDPNGAGWSESDWNKMCINTTSPDSMCEKNVERIIIAKIDSNGNVSWRYNHNNGGYVRQFGPIYKISGDQGYIIHINYINIYDPIPEHYTFIHVTTDGHLNNTTELDALPNFTSKSNSQLKEKSKSFVTLKYPPTIVFIETNGTIIGKQSLNPKFQTVLLTSDGGVIATSGQSLIKFNSSESFLWEKNYSSSTNIGKIKQIIETSDHGYLILGELTRETTTWP